MDINWYSPAPRIGDMAIIPNGELAGQIVKISGIDTKIIYEPGKTPFVWIELENVGYFKSHELGYTLRS